MQIRHLLLLLLTAAITFLGKPASAQDLIVQRAWLEDTSGRVKWPQVEQLKAEPYEGVLSQGFGNSVLWVQLRIQGTKTESTPTQDNLVLRIRPVYLDDIQVYDPAVQGGLAYSTGDQYHPSSHRLQGMDFLVPLVATAAPRDIWLRIKSTSTRQVSTTVVKETDLLNLSQKEHLLFAVYVSLVSIFSIWGLFHWFFTKEKVAGLFGLKQLAALIYALCVLGYMRIYWPTSWSAHALDLMSSLFSMLATTLGIYFHLKFLSEFKPRAWSVWIMRVLVALFPLNLFLFFVLNEPVVALRINLSSVLVAPIVLVVSALFARGWETPEQAVTMSLPRKMVVGFYALLFVILAAASLPGLGLAKGAEITLYLVQAHGLASGFLVLLMLQYRASLHQKQKKLSEQHLERVKMQSEQDRRARQEQEQLLTMLTHELKTPLATMHMRLDPASKSSQDIKRALQDMNAVIERCLQSTHLQDNALQVQPSAFDMSALIKDAVSACAQPQRVALYLPDPWPIRSDQQLLFIVLSNLLENACKYAATETPIELHAQPSDTDKGFVLIRICNAVGKSGWPDKDKLFAKYYRTPGAQRQAGTGLGLFLVRNLVQKLGGTIAYTPTDQQICFELKLPTGV